LSAVVIFTFGVIGLFLFKFSSLSFNFISLIFNIILPILKMSPSFNKYFLGLLFAIFVL
jgi:hypothetical protein